MAAAHAKKKQLLQDLNISCSQLSKTRWGEGKLLEQCAPPLRLCRAADEQIRVLAACSASAKDVLRVMHKACGGVESLTTRLLNVIDRACHDLESHSSMAEFTCSVSLLDAILGAMSLSRENCSNLSYDILGVLMSGVERILQSGKETAEDLTPLRKLLFRLPISSNVTNALISLGSSRLYGSRAVNIPNGAWSSRHTTWASDGNLSREWLIAAGTIAEDILGGDISDCQLRACDLKALACVQSQFLDHLRGDTTSSSTSHAEAARAPSQTKSYLESAEFSQIMLNTLISLSGTADTLTSGLVENMKKEIHRIKELATTEPATDSKGNLPGTEEEVKFRKQSIVFHSCLLTGILQREDVNCDTIAQLSVPGLLRCILDASSLPEDAIDAVMPLHKLVTGSTLVLYAAHELWKMLNDPSGADPIAMTSDVIHGFGCLSIDIQNALESQKQDLKDSKQVAEAIASMHCLQWSVRMHFTWLEQKEGTAPSSSSAMQASATGDQAESHDESEDILSQSSEGDGQEDNGSDLEGFIDVRPEFNSHGLLYECFSSKKVGRDIAKFIASDLADDFEDQCKELLKMPAPSLAKKCVQDAMEASPSELASGSTLKRRRVA